jgi:hypothetical protein
MPAPGKNLMQVHDRVPAATSAINAAEIQTLLFFDDEHIDQADGFTRRVHPPKKIAENPVLTSTEEWEGLLCAYGSVIRDEGVFKAYYTIWWLQKRPPYSCQAEGLAYAYSEDGVRWAKPNLGIVKEINGGRNNLIGFGLFADQPCVLRLPEALDMNHYAMAYYGDFPPLGSGVRVCFSRDGIHWNWPGQMAWQTALDTVSSQLNFYAADDTLNFYFHPVSRRFVLVRKVMQRENLLYDSARHKDFVPNREDLTRRIARCESADLIHWTGHRIILSPDSDDPALVDFHRLGVTPYAKDHLG